MSRSRTPAAIRFLTFIATTDCEDGCWLWTGSRNAHGYGKFRIGGRIGGRSVLSHRFMWWLSTGALSPVVMHRCDNTACCRPSHLRGGTQRENHADMVAKGRHRHGHGQPRQAFCQRGLHPMIGANLKIDGDGGRHCRVCATAAQRAYRAAHADAIKDYRRRNAAAIKAGKARYRARRKAALLAHAVAEREALP